MLHAFIIPLAPTNKKNRTRLVALKSTFPENFREIAIKMKKNCILNLKLGCRFSIEMSKIKVGFNGFESILNH